MSKTNQTGKLQNALQRMFSVLFKLVFLFAILLFTSYQESNPEDYAFTPPYSEIDLQYSIFTTLYANAKTNTDSLYTQVDLRDLLEEQVRLTFNQREFHPVWTSEANGNSNLYALVNLLDSTKYYGFPLDYFNSYKVKGLHAQFVNDKELDTRVSLEIAATYSALKLMLFMNAGIMGEQIQAHQQKSLLDTLPNHLNNALANGTLRESFLTLQPKLIKYKRIIASLPNFIDLQLSVKYTTPKFIDDRLLAKALHYAGFAESPQLDTISGNTPAINRLQQQFSLPIDTMLTNSAHQALVSRLEYRYYQACLNLHRLRTLGNMEQDFLLVNIPEFKLHVVEAEQTRESFNVIVGKLETPTPVFSGRIEKVVANPYWTVPRSITRDMLPRIRKDSTYLERNGYYLIDNFERKVSMSDVDWHSDDPLRNRYWLRQQSSETNALGQVKFIFPNSYSVYIHDTPSRNLFSEQNRTFSYGCIRLENPQKLAQYLTDRFFNQQEIDVNGVISSREIKEIFLDHQVEVHIQYITCSGNENAEMEFFGDVYNWDKREITSMFPVTLEI